VSPERALRQPDRRRGDRDLQCDLPGAREAANRPVRLARAVSSDATE